MRPRPGPPADVRIVDLPLRGEWVAVRSPADRLPSHGTDRLGMRYAFDFIRPAYAAGERPRPPGGIRGVLLGVPTRSWPGWGEPVLAMLAGEVVEAIDGVSERSRVHPLLEAMRALRTAVTFRATPNQVRRIVGNHVILHHADAWSVVAHLAPGSVAVRPGQQVRAGDLLGRVGHTGNSTAPHLHVQLMDGPDPLVARGVACAFRACEVTRDGQWVRVENAIPGAAERIRAVPPATR